MNKKTTENSKDTWSNLCRLTDPLMLLAIEAPLLAGWFTLEMYRGCFSIMLTLVGMVAVYQVVLILMNDNDEGLCRVPLFAIIAASGMGVGMMTDSMVGVPYGLMGVDSEGGTFSIVNDDNSMSDELND